MSIATAKQFFHRTELVLGARVLERLKNSKVILFGVGGVGSWCAEALIRTGISHLTIVDADLICPTNVNRQRQALAKNIAHPKAEALAGMLREINPEAEITAHKVLYSAETCDQFKLEEYDYVLDAIDSLKDKVLLIQKAQESGATLFASMGAAAKVDPTQIRTVPLDKTKHCPLARNVRKLLSKAGTPMKFLCVYSEEFPSEPQSESFCGSTICACPDKEEVNLCAKKARINGSLIQVTAPFGFALAALVINDITAKTKE